MKTEHSLLKSHLIILVGGLVVWLASLTINWANGIFNMITHLLLAAILIFLPLGLRLLPPSPPGWQQILYRWALWGQPVAALFVLIAFWQPTGWSAALLTSGWLMLSLITALMGIARIPTHARNSIADWCIDTALLFFPIGAGWLFLSRLGANPLDFGSLIVLLTAVHFHYAGFAAPLLAGLAGQQLAQHNWPNKSRHAFYFVATGVIGGTPLVALGITFSRPLETIAATFLASTLWVLAALMWFTVAPTFQNQTARNLLRLSASVLIITMLLASGYALGNYTGAFTITIPRMVQLHGWGNFVFVGSGLLAWWMEKNW